MQWISCVKAASNFLFRLSVRHVGRMNAQLVWLLNSLWFVSQAEWTGNFYFLSLPESQNVPCQSRRFLWNYSFCQNQRIAQCLEIKILSAVTWISLSIKFASTKEKKPSHNRTVACHMPTSFPGSLIFRAVRWETLGTRLAICIPRNKAVFNWVSKVSHN